MKKLHALNLFLFFTLFFSPTIYGSEIVFKRTQKLIKTLTLDEIQKGKLIFKDHQTLTSDNVSLYNVFRKKMTNYQAYNFYDLLNYIYGPVWKSNTKIIFTSLDGYHQIALIDQMIKNSNNKIPYLTYGENHQQHFKTFQKDQKNINPGPLYLVWSGFKTSDQASHGDPLKWPYQLVEIEIE